MIASAKMGMDFVACAPEKYFPNEELVAQCREYAKESGATITLTENVAEGTKGADVIYTDVWVFHGRAGFRLGRADPGADARTG